MKRGVFYTLKGQTYNLTYKDSGLYGYHAVIKERDYVCVGDSSLLQGVLNENGSNAGCCNFGMGHELKCPSCCLQMGELYLDCFENGTVKLFTESVQRVYGIRNEDGLNDKPLN
ncbi:hypothetical protein KJB35_04380 [Vibrio sp. D431a]|nr:hypothetical protein [Vibrio sp. D431a]